MIENFLGNLKLEEVEYKEFKKMSELSSMKVGGVARALVTPKSEKAFVETLKLLEERNIKYKIIGRMTNILPPDGAYDGILLKTDGLCSLSIKDTFVTVGAGVTLPTLAKGLLRADLGGIEELSGIPGTLGGAVVGNGGAYGKSISQLVYSVRAYSLKHGEVISLTKDNLGFAERGSLIKEKRIAVLSVTLSLCKSESAEIEEKLLEYRRKRCDSQPKAPSLGSVFKRPKGDYASRLIDLAGLKGYRIGGAEISKKHAGFIINIGGATASDVKALAQVAERRVFEKFGIKLVREIEYLE